MAIRIEFFNNIYNVKNVEARYPGGYEGFKKDFPLSIRVWYDGCLIRFGDMAFPCGGELGNDFQDCIVNAGPYTENIEELLPEKYYLSGHLMWTEKCRRNLYRVIMGSIIKVVLCTRPMTCGLKRICNW